MSRRVHRIAATLALTLAATAQAFAATIVSPVRPVPVYTPSPSLPQLKVCYTKVYLSSTTSRTFARACTSIEAPGTVRLG